MVCAFALHTQRGGGAWPYGGAMFVRLWRSYLSKRTLNEINASRRWDVFVPLSDGESQLSRKVEKLKEKKIGVINTERGETFFKQRSKLISFLPQITWTRTQSPSRGIAPSTHCVWIHARRPANRNRARSSVARAPLSAWTSRRVSYHSDAHVAPTGKLCSN